MIENNNPEINVDELMSKIREEVARRKGRGQNASLPSEYKTSQSSLPLENHVILRLHLSSLSLREPFSLRNDGVYQINDFLKYHNEEFIKNAYQGILGRVADPVGLDLYLNRLGRGVSKIEILGRLRYCSEGRKKGNKIRGLFFPLFAQMLFKIPVLGYFIRLGIAIFRLPRALHDIIDYKDYSISKNEIIQNHLNQNFNRIEKSFNQLTEDLHAKTRTFEGLRMSLESSEQGLSKLDNQIAGLKNSLNQGFGESGNRITEMEGSLAERDSRIAELEQSLNEGLSEHDNWIVGLEESLNQGLAERDSRIAELEQSLNEGLSERDNRIVGLEESLNQGLTERDNRIVGLEESLNQGLAERDSRIGEMEGSLTERDNRIARLEKSISHLKTSLVLQERRLGILLEEARKRLPEPFDEEQLQNFANAKIQLLDPLYVFFEDQFRGTREDIKDRLKVYLPLIQKANAGTDKRPILDVGCGRGEWLELLNEEGLQIRGLDINSVLVEQCRERGMDVVEGDAVEYLRTLTDASLGAVTAFQLIEHMPFEALMDLLDETVRVLKPGGLAIFETPNPENILVGTYNFYFDPTHRNPLPAPLIKFLAESRGLCRVEIKLLNPYDQAFRIRDDSSDLAKRFNDYFYGPRDYAVLGYKI